MAGQNILTESFTNADVTQPNWLYGVSQPGAANPFLTARSSSAPSSSRGLPGGGTDAAGSGALQLTNNSLDQGSFVIYNKPINSVAGLSIQFDLYAYGGISPGADGTSFFLIDGSQSPTTGGAVGGGLGYSADTTTDPDGTKNNIAGLVGGYLGVGFDEYGNFSVPGYGAGGPGDPNNPTPTSQSIAVRGSQATDYKYLTGTKLPAGTTISSTSATSRSGAVRSVRIDLDPQGKLSVYFDATGTDTFNTSNEVINDYDVAANNGALPSTFKFGFAASTGGVTNFHAVNNLTFNTFSGAYTPLVSFPPVNATVTQASPLTVTASLDVATTQDVVIPLNFSGTATKGTDYSPSADSITIKANQTTGSIVLSDTASAANGKTIQISLGTPSNATLSPQVSTVNATLADPSNYPTLIWQNPATGSAAVWGLNGTQVTPAGYTELPDGTVFAPDPSWKLISGNVDFNKDGNPDMVWFNTANTETAVWYMQPGANGLKNIIGSKSSYISAPGTSTPFQPGGGWQLVAVTTRLGSSPTLVWEDHKTGASALWQLDIDATTGQATFNAANSRLITYINGVTPVEMGGDSSGWQIVGAGNFGGTGPRNLVWFNTKTTETAIWQINGTSATNAGSAQTSNGSPVVPGLGWRPVAIASVDGTGTDQIIWQNGTAVAVWDFGSNFTLSAKSIILSSSLAAGEQIQAVADVNSDNTLDLVVRNATNSSDTTRIYTLDPTTFQIATPTTPVYLTLAGQTTPIVIGDPRWEVVDSTDVPVLAT